MDLDRFYAMNQAVILKASPEAIYLGGGLIVGGILTSLGINVNNISTILVLFFILSLIVFFSYLVSM